MSEPLVLDLKEMAAALTGVQTAAQNSAPAFKRMTEAFEASRGSGRALEELRKIMLGFKGQESVFERLEKSITELGNVSKTMASGMSEGFRALETTIKNEMQNLAGLMKSGGENAEKAFAAGAEAGKAKAGAAAEQAAKLRGERMLKLDAKYATDINTARQQIDATGTSAMLVSLQKRSETIRRILESGHKDAIKIAERTYGKDFVTTMRIGLSDQIEVLAKHGQTRLALLTSMENAAQLKRDTDYGEQQAKLINHLLKQEKTEKAAYAAHQADLIAHATREEEIRQTAYAAHQADLIAWGAREEKILQARRLARIAMWQQGPIPGAVGAYQQFDPTTGARGSVIQPPAARIVPPINPVHPDAAKNVDGLTRSVRFLNNHMLDTHSLVRGLASGFNLLWLTWGSTTPLLVGAAISMSFSKALKVGSEVAENLADIQHLAGATASEITELSAAMAKMAETTAYGPAKTSEALKVLALAGLDAKEALVALKPTLDFAITGGMSIEKSAESLVAISTAYGYGAQGMATVADTVAKTAAISMASVDSMTESFRVASVVAQQYGVTLKDSALNLAFLAQIGIRGTAAGTAMTNFYSQLVSGSGPAKKALAELKISVLDASTNAVKPYITILGELDVALRKKTAQGQQDAQQAFTTNRGNKDLSAGLAAYRKLVVDTNPELEKRVELLKKQGKEQEANNLLLKESITVAEKYKKEIEDAPGFSAIAAAGKSVTPQRQKEGLGASLTSGLNLAFQESQDRLYLIGQALRDTFNSEQFKSALAGMVSAVTTFVGGLVDLFGWLVKNKDAIADFLSTTVKALATVGAGVLAFNAVMAASAVTVVGLTLAIGKAYVAITSFGKALTVFLASPAGLIALAAGLIAAAVAWELFRDKTTEAEKALKKVNEAEAELLAANQARSKVFNESIDSAIQHYKDLEEQRRTGTNAAEIAAKRQQEAEVNLARTTIDMAEKRALAESEVLKIKLKQQILTEQFSFFGVDDTKIKKLQEELRLVEVRDDITRANANIERHDLAEKLSILKEHAKQQEKIDAATAAKDRPPTGKDGVSSSKSEYARKEADASEAYFKSLSKVLQKEKELTEVEKLKENLANGTLVLRDKNLALIGKYNQAQLMAKAYEIEEQKAINETAKEHEKYLETLNKESAAIDAQIEKFETEEKALARSITQHISLAEAIERENIVRLQSQADQLSLNGNDAAATALQNQIGKREQFLKLVANKEVREANAKAAKEATAEWKKAADKINDAITEAFMSSFDKGKGFAQSLRDSVVGMFKSMAAVRIRAIIEPVGQSMASAIGFGGGGEGGGGGGSAIGVAQTLKSMYDVAVGGFAKFAATSGAAITDLGVKVGGTLIDLGAERAGTAVMEASTNATSVGTAGSVASIAAGVAIGVTVGKAISGGLGSNAAVNVGTAIGTAIAGPIGAVIGGVVGGIGNRLFGMGEIETRAQGIEGNFGGGSFTGNKFATYYQEGGFFRGDKNWTDRSSLDDKTTEQLSRGFALLQEASKTTAASLGLSAEAIVNYSQTVSLQLTNDAEANKATLTKLFTDMGDSMAKALVPNIEFFAKEGESASKTLSRLSTSLSTVNAWLGMMDHTLLELSLTGGEAASSLIDVFGGIDNFTNSSKAFYDTYYTDAEKIAASQDAMGKALALVNLALPTSKDAFKDLAKSLDLTTDYGQQAYAVLLAIAPEFATTADMMAKASASWGTAAQKINEAIEKEVNTAATWAQKLAVLQGTVTERQLSMQADLATTTNAATQELIKQVYAQEDLKTSTDELKEKTEALAATNKGWQDQLDVLNGAMTEHSIALRDAGDDSTRSLMRQVYALQDTKAAVEKVTAAQANYTAELEKATTAAATAQGAVDSVRGEATNAYLSALGDVASAQQNLAKAQQDAALNLANIQIDAQIEIANAANTAAKEMQELGKQLRTFIDGAATPTAQFGKLLAKALGGDKEAMQALPSAATGAIDAAKLSSSTSVDFARSRGQIYNQVAGVAALAESLGQNTKTVPERLTAAALDAVAVATTELTLAQTKLADSLAAANAIGAPLTASVADLIAKFQAAQADNIKAQQDLLAAQRALDAISTNTKDTVSSVDALNGKLIVELAITSKSEIQKLIEFVTITDKLPADLKRLALDVSNTIIKTVNFAVASDTLTADQKILALKNTETIAKYLNFAVTSDTLTSEQKILALKNTETIAKYLNFAVTSDTLTPEQKTLALQNTEAIAKYLSFAVTSDTLTPEQKTLALKQTEAITKFVSFITASDTLTPEQKILALKNSEAITKSLSFATISDTLTPEQKILALKNTESIAKYFSLSVVSDTLTPEQKTLALQNTETITKYLNFVTASDTLTPEQKILALKDLDSYITNYHSFVATTHLTGDDLTLALKASGSTIENVFKATLSEASNPSAVKLALAESDIVTRTLSAAGGNLTPDQRTILEAASVGSQNVNLSATFSSAQNQIVKFDANDPIHSVFNGIAQTNARLLLGLRMDLTYLLGVNVDDNLNATAAMNSQFRGMWYQQEKIIELLGWINTESYNTNYNWLNNPLKIKFDRYAYTGGVYAHGGAFTNSVVSTPTSFDMGLMGEAGPEAIMPLVNIGGNLGVRSTGSDQNVARLEALVEILTHEVQGLRAETRAVVGNTGKAAKDLREFRDRGMTVKTDADTPLQVEPVV